MDINRQCAVKLRRLRQIKGFTLDEIEKATAGEFKSVVLGAYERGTRAISLSRLERISTFYEVPIIYFFAGESEKSSMRRWIFDLRQIRKLLDNGNEERHILSIVSLVKAIANLRNDWGGEFLTIRESDRTIANQLLVHGTLELEVELIEKKLLVNY
jgi:transcriptional regulator with XRE-family HTH domain